MKKFVQSQMPSKNQGGLSLVELTVGLAVGLIVIWGGYTLLSNVWTMFSSLTETVEREEFRASLATAIDCSATRSAVSGSCGSGTNIQLRSSSKVLIGLPVGTGATILGDFRYKAECTGQPGEYVVKYSPKKQNMWKPLTLFPIVCP